MSGSASNSGSSSAFTSSFTHTRTAEPSAGLSGGETETNARRSLSGGEAVRKGRCPLNPALPGAKLAWAFQAISRVVICVLLLPQSQLIAAAAAPAAASSAAPAAAPTAASAGAPVSWPRFKRQRVVPPTLGPGKSQPRALAPANIETNLLIDSNQSFFIPALPSSLFILSVEYWLMNEADSHILLRLIVKQ